MTSKKLQVEFILQDQLIFKNYIAYKAINSSKGRAPRVGNTIVIPKDIIQYKPAPKRQNSRSKVEQQLQSVNQGKEINRKSSRNQNKSKMYLGDDQLSQDQSQVQQNAPSDISTSQKKNKKAFSQDDDLDNEFDNLDEELENDQKLIDYDDMEDSMEEGEVKRPFDVNSEDISDNFDEDKSDINEDEGEGEGEGELDEDLEFEEDFNQSVGSKKQQNLDDLEGINMKRLTKRQQLQLKNQLQQHQNIQLEVEDNQFLSLPDKRPRKTKKPLLSEEQIALKQDKELQRRAQAQKQIEEQKQQTLDKILNATGRKKLQRQESEEKKQHQQKNKKFRQLPQNDIIIKYKSTKDGENLLLDKRILSGKQLLFDESQNFKIQESYDQIQQQSIQQNIQQINALNENLTKQQQQCSQCHHNLSKYKIPKRPKLFACSLICYKSIVAGIQ